MQIHPAETEEGEWGDVVILYSYADSTLTVYVCPTICLNNF